MKIRSLSVTIALLTASTLAYAKGPGLAPNAGTPGADAQQPVAQPAGDTAGTTTAAPAMGPSGTATGPAGGATVQIGGQSSSEGVKDTASTEGQEEKKESKLPFRGSSLLFDQSMTTQTAHLETSPQLSYIPLYEWWFSFRPRWYFTDKLYFWGRLDLTKEFTNNQETNQYREDVFGDIWLNLVYKTPVPAISKNTKATVGIRALLPTSKESQANGIYVNPGVTAGAEQTIPLKGESASFLNSARVGMSFAYNHPFSRATTPTDPNLNYERQSTDGRTFVSDQVRGTPLTNHQLTAILDTGLQVTPKLGLTLDMIWFNQWHYAATGGVTVPVSGGDVFVPRNPDDTLFTQKTWFIASLDYDILDEVTLGIGYYNLASELAPNGQRRGIIGGDNIWWSPDARVFLDVTLNIDKLYEWASGSGTKPPTPLGQPHQNTAQRNEQRLRTAF